MKTKQILHCYCCGEPYERGHFKCCAPPPGMASHKWLEQFCATCGTQTQQKCPRHCTCEKPIVNAKVDHFETFAHVAAKPATREWMPYKEREAGEEG